MVGHHFVEQLRALHPNCSIDVLSGESRLAYDRVHLSEFFSGKTAEDLAMTSAANYDELNIGYHLNAWVENIDQHNKIVCTKDGRTFSYIKLVLATGSYPFVPPIPGNDQAHCLVYRTIEDLHAIEASAKCSKVGVVVGGGLLGLEAANALKESGLQTHVVEFAPQLMAVQVDPSGGELLRQKISDLGVEVHTQKATQIIEKGDTCRYKMQFADGSHLETDLILFSAGIRPSDSLAKAFDIEVGERGGIVVDNYCQTSAQDIYAIGECALWEQKIFGLVAPGYSMARTAAAHITHGTSDETPQFKGADMSTKLKLMGVEVGSIGDAHARTEGAQTYTYENQPEGVYKKIVVDASSEKLLGAVLIGDTSDYDTLLQYALNGIELPEFPESLILPSSGDSAPALGADALPASATICSCHNVAKADVVSAIEHGETSLAGVKACTKASSGCGGCAALLKNVVDSELEKRGVEVKKDICEHFAYSRQELFQIVKVKQIKDFDSLIEEHGTGLGCDICKPAVASILASVYNDYVLEKQHLSLQDTNDTYLGNMQKDGTYSVVPRVAGGEITPDKLILLGQIAKDYSLYTKITGGQRIDLFGARVEQLPDIWKALVDGGFETGHAYAKALRTVKSCVGSTWCRYGVQDSVGLAIDLENRYKGLRAPHKIKFAVSGCTRECAEAQSKDIGVIATENGWNLYICGNGGMKPRHGDLFATDLTTDELVLYIDRLLAFYVKDADRLQRTATWMDNLEGGLEYLQDVIIHDSLGICQALEAHMQQVVDTYQCEWKTTIESESALKRFRQFVNSDATDSNVQFVEERGQIRPATQEEKSQRHGANDQSIEIVELA
ncbi:nitrite reductase large subunit NirB [Ningiella sp. W23]|uniref:nitrite reductase large subunit NirB n=1 Tax=Ningiella sp. W23 TaxID=3023715 RepID=UPI0037579CE9